ncbi:MAG: cyclic nucleotide-binding domain-containing protein [Desulfobacterales bacterium]|jgi:CRP-like cAMP-binding protein|nr:cyclic nucleotide-binding domain-containing protein [Desulfobacterales bacterium]
MSDWIDKQHSVVNRIIDGSITIDSIEEFENLIKAFPNDARLHRVFADRLVNEKSLNAADEYNTSARLFIETGMPLQAVASKIIEWRITKPSREEGLAFHEVLCKCDPMDTQAQKFFTGLAYEEMVALLTKLTLYTCPANTMVKKFGDEEHELCFVVSGALEETFHHRLENEENLKKKIRTSLVEGDFFGEIYPLTDENLSPSDIESITHVELLIISKPRLLSLCTEHPNIDLLIHTLCKSRIDSDREKSSKTVRKTTRHQLPMQVNLKIFQSETGKSPLNLSGFTDDISMGGTCVVLGAKYQTGHLDNLTGKNVKMQMSLPIESMKINILGNIVWSKEISVEGKKTAIIGIHFKEMGDIDRELLKGYCCGSEAEQNLIWSLWNSLMDK